MLMRVLLISLAALVVAGSGACKKSPTVDLALQRANFQKAQRERAIKTYDEIVKKYPNSPHAVKATERARILRQQQGPTKKK